MVEYGEKVSEGTFVSGRHRSKHRSVTLDDGTTISEGDEVRWDDPDYGDTFIMEVTGVFKIEGREEEPELIHDGEVGRVRASEVELI